MVSKSYTGREEPLILHRRQTEGFFSLLCLKRKRISSRQSTTITSSSSLLPVSSYNCRTRCCYSWNLTLIIPTAAAYALAGGLREARTRKFRPTTAPVIKWSPLRAWVQRLECPVSGKLHFLATKSDALALSKFCLVQDFSDWYCRGKGLLVRFGSHYFTLVGFFSRWPLFLGRSRLLVFLSCCLLPTWRLQSNM